MAIAKRIRFHHGGEVVTEAQQLTWLMQYFQGDSLRGIAKMAHRGIPVVREGLATAASKLVKDAHETVMRDLFPLATQVMKQHLQNELAKATNGGVPDLALAERIMKGMYVFDAPVLKEQLSPTPAEPEQEIDSIGLVVAKMREKQLTAKPDEPKQLTDATVNPNADIVEGEVAHGRKDNSK